MSTLHLLEFIVSREALGEVVTPRALAMSVAAAVRDNIVLPRGDNLFVTVSVIRAPHPVCVHCGGDHQ